MDEENVVSFRSASPSARLKKFDHDDKRQHCQHKSIEVWCKEPIIECTACGAVVDPYWWIRERCNDWREMVAAITWRRDEAQRELDELKARLRILRKEYATEAERIRAESQLMHMPPQRSGS